MGPCRDSKVARNVADRMTAAKFELARRFAIGMMTIFVCLSYSPSMPLLYFIGAATMAVMYFCDKYWLLRHYTVPDKKWDEMLAVQACKLLPFAAVFHLGFAISM